MSGMANRLKDSLNIDGHRTFTGTGDITMASEGVLIVKKGTGAATAVTLPANPRIGQFAFVKDGKGDANSNNISITGAASATIDGSGSAVVLNSAYGKALFHWNGTEWSRWI